MKRWITFCICATLAAAAMGSARAQARVDASTLEGKVLFGYQGWFRTPCDGSNAGWSHWSRGAPSPATMTVDLYPDLSEFAQEDLCPIPGETIGGKPAYLFSSVNSKVVMRHFEWMRQYGLDGVLVQRFVSDIPGSRAQGDGVLKNIVAAAEKTGRTFAIEYDVSGAPQTEWRPSSRPTGSIWSTRCASPRAAGTCGRTVNPSSQSGEWA